MKGNRFIVITHTDRTTFEELVEETLNEGYVLHGSLVVSNGVLYQTLIAEADRHEK